MQLVSKIILAGYLSLFSLNTHADIDGLFSALEEFYQKSEWQKFDTTLQTVFAYFKHAPPTKTPENMYRANLFEISGHLARRDFERLYEQIFQVSATLFPRLRPHLGQNENSEIAEERLFECLMMPKDFITRSRREYRWVASELLCDLAEYYIFNDKLQKAEALLVVLIKQANAVLHSRHHSDYYSHYLDLNIRAHRLLGSAYFYMGDYKNAVKRFNEAKEIAVQTLGTSIESGYIYLGLANVALARQDAVTLKANLTKADANFKILNPVTIENQKIHPLGLTYKKLMIEDYRIDFTPDADGIEESLTKLAEKFRLLCDPFGEGLALSSLCKLLSIKQSLSKGLSSQTTQDTLKSQAFILANKHKIPLLKRLVHGSNYIPSDFIDIDSETLVTETASTTSSTSTTSTPRSSDNSLSNSGSQPSLLEDSTSAKSSSSSSTSSTSPTPRPTLSGSGSFRKSPRRVPGTRTTALALSGE